MNASIYLDVRHKRLAAQITVFSERIPKSGYEQVNGLDLEVYGGDDKERYIELWYPV